MVFTVDWIGSDCERDDEMNGCWRAEFIALGKVMVRMT